MTVFIPGPLPNPQAHGARSHWSKHATTVRRQREKAQMCLLANGAREMMRTVRASHPKTVTFTAYVFNAFDDDVLPFSLKPTRDALKDMLIIDDDRPSAGHTFVYKQVVSRGKNAKRGVEITVELARK